MVAAAALLEMIVVHLSEQGQGYRVEGLYEGPMDDECAQGIREYSKDSPLMMYVSKMIQQFFNSVSTPFKPRFLR